MSQHPACIVAMAAGATAHCWGREIEKLGRMVRLIAPNYVKPFVKRQMNDVADAEAVVEAARRDQTRRGANHSLGNGDLCAGSELLEPRQGFCSLAGIGS